MGFWLFSQEILKKIVFGVLVRLQYKKSLLILWWNNINYENLFQFLQQKQSNGTNLNNKVPHTSVLKFEDNWDMQLHLPRHTQFIFQVNIRVRVTVQSRMQQWALLQRQSVISSSLFNCPLLNGKQLPTFTARAEEFYIFWGAPSVEK